MTESAESVAIDVRHVEPTALRPCAAVIGQRPGPLTTTASDRPAVTLVAGGEDD